MSLLHYTLVTGAAGGIGAATVLRLAQLGRRLVLVGRDQAQLEGIRSRALSAGSFDVAIELCQFEDPKSVAEFLDRQPAGRVIEELIHCAGTAVGSERLEKTEILDIRAMIEVNFTSLVMLTRHFIPAMIERKSGHIVVIGSAAGIWASSRFSIYGATKSALRAFHESLRIELLGHKVRFTLIEPGTVENGFALKRMKGNSSRANLIYQGFQPLSSENVAETVVWSLSQPKHVNIHEIVLSSVDQVGAAHTYRVRSEQAEET